VRGAFRQKLPEKTAVFSLKKYLRWSRDTNISKCCPAVVSEAEGILGIGVANLE
jgi:hypothetical protein